MCGPLTPKISLRYIASQIEAQVFSSAHAPAGVFQTHTHGAADEDAGGAPLDAAVRVGVKAVEIVLAVWAAGVVRVGAARHAEVVGVVAAASRWPSFKA